MAQSFIRIVFLNLLICLVLTVGLKLGAKKDDHASSQDLEHSWGYRGAYAPLNWDRIDSGCSSLHARQSPIDISTSGSIYLSSLKEISLVSSTQQISSTVTNNGHTVSFSIPSPVRLNGYGLGCSYRAEQLHFHWGETSREGSEHKINGRAYPLEMHIVSYNEDQYSSVSAAVNGQNSLAVLGVLFQISNEDNPALKPLIDTLQNVRVKGSEAKLDSLDVESLLPSNTRDYYRYEGSLTTPPCAESVVWTVFRYTVNVSERQVAEFRQLLEGSKADGHKTKLNKNWRPVQPLHQRAIYRSFQ